MSAPYLRHVISNKTYFYCTCGYSKTQPFCDGESHEGTGFKPLKFIHQRDQTLISICGCKYNKTTVGYF